MSGQGFPDFHKAISPKRIVRHGPRKFSVVDCRWALYSRKGSLKKRAS